MVKTRNSFSAQDIRSLREALNLTRRELAAKLGISWRTVEQYEQGLKRPGGAVTLLLNQLENQTLTTR